MTPMSQVILMFDMTIYNHIYFHIKTLFSNHIFTEEFLTDDHFFLPPFYVFILNFQI